MSVVYVVIVLLCVGVVLYFLPRVPFVDATMKLICRWVIIIGVIIWLLVLTGILDKVATIKFPHF